MTKTELKQLSVNFGQDSQQGSKEFNEDSYACISPTSPSILAYKGVVATICDGVGGTGSGQEASQTCIQKIYNEYFNSPDSWGVKKSGEEVLKEINQWLYTHSSGQEAHRMLSTISMAVFCGRKLHIFHMGDSRIYRLRGNEFKLMTEDHHYPEMDNLLLRALGMDSVPNIDYSTDFLEEGDLYFMSTDGVHKWAEDEFLKTTLMEEKNLEKACQKITTMAIEKGSDDNSSCQAVRVTSLPLASRTELVEEIDNLSFPPFFNPDEEIDDYKIIKELAHKTMSSVYLAKEISTGHEVAIKCPSQDFEGDPAYLERFLREEWVGKRFHCPQLMKIHTIKSLRSKYHYFVMEYCRGDDLQQRIDQKKYLSLNEGIDVVKQLCKALNFMHNLDILHRDIKPDNIIYSPEGILKIIDYGIVRISGLNALHTHDEIQTLVGSPNFMAPEIFKNSTGSPQSDIFSMGVTIYYALSGHFPYGEIYQATDYKDKEYRNLQRYRDDVPDWLEAIIEKMVQLDSHHRYQAVSEIVYQVEHPGASPLRRNKRKPLLERNPTKFWKNLCVALVLINLICLYIIASK